MKRRAYRDPSLDERVKDFWRSWAFAFCFAGAAIVLGLLAPQRHAVLAGCFVVLIAAITFRSAPLFFYFAFIITAVSPQDEFPNLGREWRLVAAAGAILTVPWIARHLHRLPHPSDAEATAAKFKIGDAEHHGTTAVAVAVSTPIIIHFINWLLTKLT